MADRPSRPSAEPILVDSFVHPWEADLAREYLSEDGIPAWVEKSGLDNPYRVAAGGMGLVGLYVPANRAEEARTLLARLAAAGGGVSAVPAEGQEVGANGGVRREPPWRVGAGGAVVVALAVSAVLGRLPIPGLVVVAVAVLLWALLRWGGTGSNRA
jgi:hypothetical protein